jgi:hypothetical protein
VSNLGFGGAAGVGRPFTIQDLFSAVSGQQTGASTQATVINQFLDEEGETITIDDTFTLALVASGGYDTELWTAGVWN